MKNSFNTLGLLLIMLIALSGTLSLLALATANSDLHRAERQSELAATRQELVNEAEAWLAELSFSGEDGIYSRTFGGERNFSSDFTEDYGAGHTLSVSVEIKDGRIDITDWRHRAEWAHSSSLGKLPQL